MAFNVIQTELAKGVSIADYRELEYRADRDELAAFLSRRFRERYISPLDAPRDKKHGFCTMAICCLMIETLESFWQGWPDSDSHSRAAFQSFFNRPEAGELGVFRKHSDQFYKHVRCGILHQAETTGGWRIRREGELFDASTRLINATSFLKELERSLEAYCLKLRDSDWGSDLWKNFRRKMDAICRNCGEPT